MEEKEEEILFLLFSYLTYSGDYSFSWRVQFSYYVVVHKKGILHLLVSMLENRVTAGLTYW